MQNASKSYKESIKKPIRNNGYIRATIGLVNQNAQKTARADIAKNKLTYFSDNKKIFEGYSVSKVYATAEQDFSKVDGSMYFLPSEESGLEYYNNGLVTEDLLGKIYIDFSGNQGFDIKGMMINFGEYYPKSFDIEWDNGRKNYQNKDGNFITEDVFDGVSFLRIIPIEMINGHGRLRIESITFGVAKIFTNEDVLSYSLKDYVSSISENLPSQDMSLEVDNQDLYYSVDNPESAFAFLETGQEVQVEFGYDVSGNSDIEWLPPNTCFLNSWKADDTKAVFTAIDRFAYMNGTYYKGVFRPHGISLYDLAVDVLRDAGITDEREYFLDQYLKNIIVNNPMPPVRHTEALQIIANAGRCILYQDRQKRIHIQSSFVPEMSVEVNNQTEYSKIDNLLRNTKKDAYAICSNDFSVVDGSLFFMPENAPFKETGYISNSISDENGKFTQNPVISILMETAFTAYGLIIKFRNVAPKNFVIRTYLQGISVENKFVENTDLEFVTYDTFEMFDRMEIEFTKGYPNARITVDNILISDITDYTLERDVDIYGNPIGERKNKVKSISVARNVYNENAEQKELATEEVVLNQGITEEIVYLQNPSYDFSVSVEESGVSAEVIEQSNYMARIRFNKGVKNDSPTKYRLLGKMYDVKKFWHTVRHNPNGEEISWENPLVSTISHSADLQNWLSSYFPGDVAYEVSWRGDPRIDAGDLVYLELKNRESAITKIYENNLSFKGSWNAVSKVRKAAVKWQ